MSSVASQPIVSPARVRSEGAQPRSQINVVLFSGGSGTHSITEALIRHKQIALHILINAYDDGHSTGRLRRFIPGMLGPSDVRKNINRLMPDTQDRHRALKSLSDYRLPAKYPFALGTRLVERLAAGLPPDLPKCLLADLDALSVLQARTFQRYFRRFAEYSEAELACGNRFDFDDCALGNILFGGCYLDEGRSFNRAIA